MCRNCQFMTWTVTILWCDPNTGTNLATSSVVWYWETGEANTVLASGPWEVWAQKVWGQAQAEGMRVRENSGKESEEAGTPQVLQRKQERKDWDSALAAWPESFTTGKYCLLWKWEFVLPLNCIIELYLWLEPRKLVRVVGTTLERKAWVWARRMWRMLCIYSNCGRCLGDIVMGDGRQ